MLLCFKHSAHTSLNYEHFLDGINHAGDLLRVAVCSWTHESDKVVLEVQACFIVIGLWVSLFLSLMYTLCHPQV